MWRTRAGLIVSVVTLATAVVILGRSAETGRTAQTLGAPVRKEVRLCVLEAIPRDMHTRVPPPPAFDRDVRQGGPGASAVAITVNYTGFTAEAQAAFQYAVDIWRSQLTSSGPIVVNAEFTSVGIGPTVLGQAGASWSFRDFPGATKTNTWYAKALANKLFGADVSPAFTPEITAQFNSAFTWYFGTDGNTPSGRYDFVSVVLHELGHGLGFAGSASESGGLGYLTSSGYPGIYDYFVENGSGQALLTAFTSGTAGLAAQFQGNNLYWNGTSGTSGGGGSKPRLHAPATWSAGSSYSHLDEATYPAGNANSLMTPAIGSAESIHDPGAITRGMFADMGWTADASTAPSITTHPSDQTVTAGSAASFTAAASGIPTPTVQWQVSTNAGTSWTNASGATSTSYSFTTGGTDNGRQYRAVFTNLAGTATSNAATLTVNVAPAVTTHPSSQTAVAGQTVSFTSAATGTPTPTVQWQVSTDGGSTWTAMKGATASIYSVAAGAVDDGKRFRAVFTNVVGSATTNSALLTVEVLAVLSVSPSSGSTNGATVLTVAGTGFISAGTTVMIGGNAATTVSVSSSRRLTATTPAGVVGPAVVTVTTTYQSASLDGGYRYYYSPFTDDPLQAGITPIKAIHVRELRQQIDDRRTRYNLAAYAWTDPAVVAGTTPAKAAHIIEMRDALREAYVAAGRTPPTYTDSILLPGSSVIRAVHLTELRAAALALE